MNSNASLREGFEYNLNIINLNFSIGVFFILFAMSEKHLGFRLLGILSIVLISILFLVFAIWTEVALPELVSGYFSQVFKLSCPVTAFPVY